MGTTTLLILFFLTAGMAFGQETGSPASETPAQKADSSLTLVDEFAGFLGGTQALRAYLKESIHYPKDCEIIAEKCIVRFKVSSTGQISEATIIKGSPDCPAYDAEILRVINAMPPWNPARRQGKKVDSYSHLPINVHLK
jgi:outer membrane biosynthesis protein TonB